MSGERGSTRATRRDVPQAHDLVIASRREDLAIGAEGKAAHGRAGRRDRRAEQTLRAHAPEAKHAVVTAGGDDPARGAERNRARDTAGSPYG